MLSVLVVDDEVPALEELTFLLREDPRIERAIPAGCPAAALRELSRMVVAGERLDAVFLDLRMPGLDGLDFSRLLSGFATPPAVVFVTAHDDAAVAAFEVGAVDYLLKPVRPERLAEAIRRVAATAAGTSAHDDETIPVELAGRTRLVARSAVFYAEAHGDYVRLHTTEGKKYLVRIPLAALARRWRAAGFIRIHRSTLVAAEHISELRFDDGRAIVHVGDACLPVSRRHTREVRDLLVRRFRAAGAPDCEHAGAGGPDDANGLDGLADADDLAGPAGSAGPAGPAGPDRDDGDA